MVVLYPRDSISNKIFVPNGRFRLVRGTHYTAATGLAFPQEDSTWIGHPYSLDRRVIVGPSFDCNCFIPANSNHNKNLSINIRMLGCRNNSALFEHVLRRAGTAYILRHSTTFADYARQLGPLEWPHDLVDNARWTCEQDNPKKRARETCLQQLTESGVIGWTKWHKNVNWMLKRNEQLEAGDGVTTWDKVPRNVVDLTMPASLQAGWYAHLCKHWMDGVDVHDSGCVARYVGQSTSDAVTSMLEDGNSSLSPIFAGFFSDDSCYFTYDGTTKRRFNVDVKQCDMSHVPETFDLLFELTKPPRLIEQAIRQQIMSNVTISSVDGKYTVVLAPNSPYLQSGIVITTLINNIAQWVLFSCCVKLRAYTADGIKRAGLACGYWLTVTEVGSIYESQFLKMSLCDCTYKGQATRRAIVNLGVVLRACGRVKAELPGKEAWELKAKNFVHQVLTGLLAGSHHATLELLKPGGYKQVDLRGISGLLDRGWDWGERAELERDAYSKRYPAITLRDRKSVV